MEPIIARLYSIPDGTGCVDSLHDNIDLTAPGLEELLKSYTAEEEGLLLEVEDEDGFFHTLRIDTPEWNLPAGRNELTDHSTASLKLNRFRHFLRSLPESPAHRLASTLSGVQIRTAESVSNAYLCRLEVTETGDPVLWNGWVVPFFLRSTINKIIAQWNRSPAAVDGIVSHFATAFKKDTEELFLMEILPDNTLADPDHPWTKLPSLTSDKGVRFYSIPGWCFEPAGSRREV